MNGPNLKELETITLSLSFELKNGSQEIPLRVTVFPPKDPNTANTSDIRVSARTDQAAFITGLLSEILPDVLRELDQLAADNGDDTCDCENCQRRRELFKQKRGKPSRTLN